MRAAIGPRNFHVFAHAVDGVIILELEAVGPDLPVVDLYSEVQSSIGQLQNTTDLDSFFRLAVEPMAINGPISILEAGDTVIQRPNP